ncbi:MAG: hypothetical protein K0R18_2580, partial [Bacillales bacterium]|nr:hypothetical protein [Bacillales bacterium]
MSIGELLSVFFYFSGIISIMFGIYGLYINSKEKLYKIFFALCISLSVWAIGFSMSIDANDLEQCLFWRRFSALGWGAMYSILLHFCFVLTGKDKLLKNWWHYLLLYTPAAVAIFIFAISNEMALQQYHLVKTSFGWINVSVNNGWDWFFHIYYSVYLLCGLGLVWKWGKNTYSDKIKKKGSLIVSLILVGLLLTTAIDIICNSVSSINILQIVPIIILIPIIAVNYCILRYGLMNPTQFSKAEDILNEPTRAKVYSHLSSTFVAGSVVSFIVQFIYYKNLVYPLYSSGFILLLGIIIHILQKSKLEDFTKDTLLIMTVFIATPSITLIFIEFESVAIWAFPIIFIIVSLLFSKPILFTSTAISILSTQILVWMLKPEAFIIDKIDYLGRIGVLCIVIRIAFYVNKIYIKRLSQNADQLSLQRFISEISSDFINVDQSNIDEKINWVIKIVGKLFSIDQINKLLIDLEHQTIEYTTIWDAEENGARENYKHNIQFDDISWLMNQLISRESIYIPNVDLLPDAAARMKNEFKKRKICSVVAIPIQERGKTIGILEFTSGNSTKIFQDDEMRVLKIIANIFDDALTKVEAENEIKYMAYHDHLTCLPNRRLFKDRLNQAIALAKRTEKLIGVIFIDLDSFKN